jgi:hypothetical protein
VRPAAGALGLLCSWRVEWQQEYWAGLDAARGWSGSAVGASIAVKTPRPTLFDDFKPRLVVPIEQLVGDSASGIFVRQFVCLGTEPLHVDNRNKAVRQDAPDRCIVGGLRVSPIKSSELFFSRT